MIQETGQVIKTDGEFAWVQTQRQSTCGACAAKKGCGTNVFSKVLGKKHIQFKAVNTLDVKPGDMVVLGLRESALLKSALMIYLLPLLSMFLCAAAMDIFSKAIGLGDIQAWVVIAGLTGLLAAFGLVHFFTKNHLSDSDYQPVILRRATLSEQFSLHSAQEV
jgi:sigma-E factor negative regulatory protein RseC